MRMTGAVSLLLLLSSSCFADSLPAPVPSNLTNHDMHRVQLAYNRRTLAEEYQRFGERDPKWDAAVVAFFDRVAVRYTDSSYPEFYSSGEDTSIAAIRKLSEPATEAGCTDPLFLYVKTLLLQTTNDYNEHESAFKKTTPVFLASKYSADKKFWAINHYLTLTGVRADTDNLPGLITLREQLVLQVMLDPVADPLDRRIRITVYRDGFEKVPTPEQAEFIALLDAAPNVDAWTKHMLHGMYEIHLAWDARGHGWASSVTAEGGRNFRSHMNQAKVEFEAAYTLEPSYPEAATAMIQVATAQDDVDAQRVWFDRAKVAQLDYMPAWKTYTNSLLPRWGGSHLQMYALGCEAMRTRRFDTAVPNYLIEVLQSIAKDGDSDDKTDYAFYRLPSVWTNLKSVFEGYLAKPHPGMDADQWRSCEAAVAFRCDAYDDAVAILDAIKGRVKTEAMSRYDTSFDEVDSTSRAMTSNVSAELKQALENETQGDFQTAKTQLSAVLHAITPDHAAWRYTQRHTQLCDIAGPLARGEKVKFPLATDADLSCWDGDKTGWKIDADGLSFSSDKATTSTLRHRVVMPSNARIGVEWSYKQPNPPAAPFVFLEFVKISHADAQVVRAAAYPDLDRLAIDTKAWNFKDNHTDPKMPADQWHTWVIEHRGDTVSLEHDGVLLVKPIQNGWIDGIPILSLAVTLPAGGGSVRFRNLTVESLDAPLGP